MSKTAEFFTCFVHTKEHEIHYKITYAMYLIYHVVIMSAEVPDICSQEFHFIA